MINLIKIKC